MYKIIVLFLFQKKWIFILTFLVIQSIKNWRAHIVIIACFKHVRAEIIKTWSLEFVHFIICAVKDGALGFIFKKGRGIWFEIWRWSRIEIIFLIYKSSLGKGSIKKIKRFIRILLFLRLSWSKVISMGWRLWIYIKFKYFCI